MRHDGGLFSSDSVWIRTAPARQQRGKQNKGAPNFVRQGCYILYTTIYTITIYIYHYILFTSIGIVVCKYILLHTPLLGAEPEMAEGIEIGLTELS